DLVKWGRAFSPLDIDQLNRVCIINDSLAKALFVNTSPFEESLTIHGQRYKIIGVLDPDGSSDIMGAMNSLNSGADDFSVIIPYQLALRISGNNITSLEVFIDDTTFTDQVVSEVEGVLAQAFNYKDHAYNVINLDSLLDTMNTMLDMMKTMLVGIASIALLVGGIGIMNMMLVSVTERTSEIGLRKALGAQPKQIQAQFLLESIMLSVVGGLLGIVLGNVFSIVAARAMNFTFQISLGAVSLGFGFSLVVGVVFGWTPARKASKLNPIDALRSM
ncbi:MAG: FtsX-like permease family protein, partial [Clostridiales bacterium]|nr:FtsX-like permease family protein [Clostridiales bacterium]